MNIDVPYYLQLFQIQQIIHEYSIINEILTPLKKKEILTQI